MHNEIGSKPGDPGGYYVILYYLPWGFNINLVILPLSDHPGNTQKVKYVRKGFIFLNKQTTASLLCEDHFPYKCFGQICLMV
jgi:hypothetical protein